MSIGSGLSGQFGYKLETTWGTAVTVDTFQVHEGDNLEIDQNWAQSAGLQAGQQVQLAGYAQQTTRSAKGAVPLEFATKKMGQLAKVAVGSTVTTPTLIAGSAYKQVHQLGTFFGIGLTTQFGRPQTDGTVKPFTYPGCKVGGWELSCSEGELLKLQLDLIAKDETNLSTTPAGAALAAAVYPTGNEAFTFNQAVFKIGGTASTASSVVSVAGGAVVGATSGAIVKGFTFKGTNPFAADRFGTATTVSEPIQNAMTQIELELDCEFASQAEFYDVFRAGTVTPVQITFTGATLISGTSYPTLDLILSAPKILKAPVPVSGPGIVRQKVSFKAYRDGTNSPFQVTITSGDVAL